MAHIHEKIDFTVAIFVVHERKVLVVHHRKLDQWLPLGGHIELEEDPEQAALREAEEESGLEVELAFEPHPASLTDVGTILFARVRRLFLYVMSWRSKKRQIIDGETFSPRARSRRSQISTSVRSGSRRLSPSR